MKAKADNEFYLREPIGLSVELNLEDKLNWRFHNKSGNVRKETLSSKYLNQIISFLNSTASIKYLVLTGREPFEFQKLTNLLEIAKRRGISVSVDTNVNFLFPKLFTYDFNRINQIRLKLLSLYSKKHDYWIGEKGHYKKINAFLSFLERRKNISKVIIFPIFKFNYEEIEKVTKFASGNKMYCNLFPYPYFACKKSYRLNKNLFWRIMNKIQKLKKKYPTTVITDSPIAGVKYKKLCGQYPFLKIMMHIDVNGNLRICKYANFIIGSLDKLSLDKLWLQQQKFFNSQLSNKCKQCKDLSICGGGCFGNKQFLSQPDYYCIHR